MSTEAPAATTILQGDRFRDDATGNVATVLIAKPGRVYVDREKGPARWYTTSVFTAGYTRL